MSLTFWNRRRREAGDTRSPDEVLEANIETAGEPGTVGVEGHTGTDQTEPPFGAPEAEGEEVDASGETHEVAAAETDPEAAAEEAAEVADDIAAVEAEPVEVPKGNASRDEWVAYAVAQGHAPGSLEGVSRDDIRDLFA